MNSFTESTGRVLITGASSGIGLHLAREFAKHGHSLVLVAPVEEELKSIADTIGSEFNVTVLPLPVDLTEEDAVDRIAGQLAAEHVEIEILVNNAGLGQRGRFWENPPERDIEMLRPNIEAVVRLTRAFLPAMIERGHGRILNTASVAGFEPGPTLAVYHATKAFVLSFSESLATELEKTGVTLTALCPGATDTDFFPKADMLETNAFQKGNLMAPQPVAEAAFNALMAGERIIVPGGMNKTMVAMRRVLPESMQAKKNEKLYSEVEPEKHKRDRGDKEYAEAAKDTKR